MGPPDNRRTTPSITVIFTASGDEKTAHDYAPLALPLNQHLGEDWAVV